MPNRFRHAVSTALLCAITCLATCWGSSAFALDPWWDVFWRKTDGTNAIWQFTGSGPTDFVASFPPGVTGSWEARFTGDINGDGVPDVVWLDSTSGQVAIWLMSSSSVISVATFPGAVGAGSQWKLAAIGDVNGDGRSDLVWRNAASDQALVWLMDGSGLLGGTLDLGVVAPSYELMGIGDFNGDGFEDLLWFQATDGQVALWLMGAGGTHTAVFPGAVGPGTWRPYPVGDFDGDGNADIFWRERATGMTATWYMNGGTIADFDFFVSVPLADWTVGSVGDFNLDLTSDLMWYAPGSGGVVRWMMKGRHQTPMVEMLPSVGTGWQMVPVEPVKATPVCTISASSLTPTVGDILTLTASCDGSPGAYIWTGCSSFSSVCTTSAGVAGPVIYRVAAVNQFGAGVAAEQAVTWQGGSGAGDFCAPYASVIGDVVTWGDRSGVRIYTSAMGGFGPHTALVMQFTVPPEPATYATPGNVSFAEFGDPATIRQQTISLSRCDFRAVDATGANGPVAKSEGSTTVIGFNAGVLPPNLVAGATYYLNIRNYSSDLGTTCSTGACNGSVTFNWPK